jgi:hypothetical protein
MGGHLRRGVPEQLLPDAGIDSALGERRSVGVPQIVYPKIIQYFPTRRLFDLL